jgi:peptidyl-prolyl cis-trans isomerase D
VISSMREYFRSLKFILIIIIVAFVGTSVVYFGASAISGGGGKHNVVASVDGEEIPVERFRRGQANMIRAYESASRKHLSTEDAERMGINQQVISDLVRDAVIVQGAEREGIRVSDEELRQRIQEVREFQLNGRFSRDQYLRLLRLAKFEPAEFESEMRRQIKRERLEALVMAGAKLSEAELREAYTLLNERVRGDWASMAVEPLMAGMSVAAEELEPYVSAHKAQFTRPERRRIEYVVLTSAMFPQPVSDHDVEAYYKAHESEFERPRRIHVAHILVRVPSVGGSEAENQARAKVAAVIKRVQGGEDFAKVAKEVSEDTANAGQGGDLGWIGTGELVPQFEQAAFALKKGEVSAAPVRTPFGYHAIKVLDTREGGKSPLKEVAPQIKAKLSLEGADKAAQAKADTVRVPLMEAKSFAAEAKTLGLEVREATMGRGDGLPGIGREAALEDAVFSLALGGVSAPVKIRDGYVVVKALEQLPAGVPPLPEIRARVIESIKRDRAEALALERAKALIASLAKGGDFVTAAKAAGFSTGEIPFFSRSEPPKERGAVPNLVLLAALQTAAGHVSDPVRTGTAVYVVKTLARQPPDPQGFEKARAELEKRLLEQKRSDIMESWIRARRASAKIEIAGQLLPNPR